MVCISIAINFLGGFGLSIQKWAAENAIVIAMVPATVAPLVWRDRRIQIAAPVLEQLLVVRGVERSTA